MAEPSGNELPPARGPLALWTGILAPPLVWFADLTVSYPLVYRACHSGRMLPLDVATALALVLVGASGLTAWSRLRSVPAEPTVQGGRSADRSRFMAVVGLASSALFGLAVLALAVPRWILGPCQP